MTQALSMADFSPANLFTRSGGSGSSGGGGGGNCPPIWNTISQDFTKMFLDTATGQCNDDARAAIRAAFHDAGTWSAKLAAAGQDFGGADGSLILAQEYNRPENNGLQDISAKILAVAKNRGVGVADTIQFAAAHAVVTCPLGPVVKAFVGRKDSAVPSPDGLLPDVHASGDSLFALFQDKGFNAVDLAALLGAHTTSKQFHVDPAQAGAPQDSTPGIWDVKYYGETFNPPAGVFRFESDINLSKQAQVGKEFQGFVNNQGKWAGKFADAMSRLSILGIKTGFAGLIDCTGALPKGTGRRDVRAAGIMERAV